MAKCRMFVYCTGSSGGMEMIVSFLYLAVFILTGVYEVWRIISLFGSIWSCNQALSTLDPGTAAYSQLQGVITGSTVELVIVFALLILTLICIFRFIWYAIIQNAAMILKTKTSDVIKTTNNK